MGPRSEDGGPGKRSGWALRLHESWEEVALDSKSESERDTAGW